MINWRQSQTRREYSHFMIINRSAGEQNLVSLIINESHLHYKMKLENLKNPTTTKQSWEWYCLSTLVSTSVQIPDTDQWLEAEAAPEQAGQYCYSYKKGRKAFLVLGLSNAFPISYSAFSFLILMCSSVLEGMFQMKGSFAFSHTDVQTNLIFAFWCIRVKWESQRPK